MKKLLVMFLVLIFFSCTKDLYEIPTSKDNALKFTIKGNVGLGTTHPHEALYIFRTSDTSKYIGIGGKCPSEKLHIITKP